MSNSAQDVQQILKHRAKRYFQSNSREVTSTTEYLTFRRADTTFAVSVTELQDVHPAPELVTLPLIASHIIGVVPVRGEITAIYDLYQFLYKSQLDTVNDLYLIRGGASMANMALAADELLSVIELRESDIRPLPVSLSGCTSYLKGITADEEIVVSFNGLHNNKPFFKA